MENRALKICQSCKKEFVIEPDDFAFYAKIDVPPPTWCQQCRMMRRMLFRNERKLFRVKDDVTGDSVLSLFPPEAGYTTYNDKYWWDASKWNPLDFGRDFDARRPFLSQLFELNRAVPKYRSAAMNMVNSEYSANAADLKNCYLLFNSNFTEDSGYGNGIDFCRDCYDNSHLQKSERCYGSFWLTGCYATYFSSQCDSCHSLWFSKNCRGCSNCFGCVNLRNKNYCFFNEQLTKEDYALQVQKLRLDTWDGLRGAVQRVKNFWLKFPIQYLQGVQNVHVSGDFITHSKNAYKSYLIRQCEDIRYVQYSQVPSSRDCMDGSVIGCEAELLYETSVCGWGASNLKFCWECWDNVKDLEYCIYCGHGAENLFGCAGVIRLQYCILNKQYSKHEYETLKKKIIEHMNVVPYVDPQGRVYKYGDFFPPEFSPFAYNQTIAPEHVALTKDAAVAFGARWQDARPNEYRITLTADQIPNTIQGVSDDITKEIIQCIECKKAYKIIDAELQFLRRAGIPLPRACIDCRHAARIVQRNRAIFFDRQCACDDLIYKNNNVHDHHKDGRCRNLFTTSYAPDRPEIVYCETCYNNEII